MEQFQKYFHNDCIIATRRNQRPFINERDVMCPFCLANKNLLEDIIDERWEDNELLVRIVPNLYPLTNDENAPGVHDVIIDTGRHMLHPKDFSLLHWCTLLVVMQNRWKMLMNKDQIKFIQIFKNFGTNAGASISHSHWQLVALEEIPYSLKMKYQIYNYSGADHCYLCSEDRKKEGWIIAEDEHWEVWVPPVPQFPYEVWLIPKKHYQHYGQLSLEEINNLGMLMKYLLLTYDQIEPGYAFNICFMSGDLNHIYPYHFYIKVVLRRGQIAGFEIATGCHILAVAPELYAKQIQKILKGMYK